MVGRNTRYCDVCGHVERSHVIGGIPGRGENIWCKRCKRYYSASKSKTGVITVKGKEQNFIDTKLKIEKVD